jgi:hypothetical protein
MFVKADKLLKYSRICAPAGLWHAETSSQSCFWWFEERVVWQASGFVHLFFESGFLEQVLGAHPYLHRLHCIKIRASSFPPLKHLLIFISVTPHNFLTWNFADHSNITTRLWEKYFGFFMSLCIYMFQEFILNFKITWNLNCKKHSKLFFSYSICYFSLTCRKIRSIIYEI